MLKMLKKKKKKVKLLLHYSAGVDKCFWVPWGSGTEISVKTYVIQILKVTLVLGLAVPRQPTTQLCLSRHSHAAGSSTPAPCNTWIVSLIYD